MQCLVIRSFKRNGKIIPFGELVDLPEVDARMLKAAGKVEIILGSGAIGAIGETETGGVDLVNESAKALRPRKRKGKTA